MFKKIILASALAISTSFASWDLFPVLENHKGQTRFTTTYSTYSDEGREYHALNLTLGSRYTVFPDLELALIVPYHVFSYYNGNKIGTDGTGKIWLQEDGSKIIRYRCTTSDSRWQQLDYYVSKAGTVYAVDWKYEP